MNSVPALAGDFAACRALHRHHGKSYFYATRFLPQTKRDATHALYAFFRVPDEIVDNPEPTDLATVLQQLNAFREEWRRALAGKSSENPVIRATAATFEAYAIPPQYAEDFLATMIQDVTVSRYATYTDLERYMYGSAAVVGLMMSHVVGFRDVCALPYAEKLGYAMQLTNFLRDVGEDYQQRGRVYLPQDEMQRFGVTDANIAAGLVTDEFRALMEFQIARARALYAEAEPGITLLHRDGQVAVSVASRLYAAILRKIERQHYDVFSKRARTSLPEKMWLSARAIRT